MEKRTGIPEQQMDLDLVNDILPPTNYNTGLFMGSGAKTKTQIKTIANMGYNSLLQFVNLKPLNKQIGWIPYGKI
nr:hypothetical protein [uncultured Allomuricauda sp.]